MFKYRGYSNIGRILAGRLGDVLQSVDLNQFEKFVPVPLHRLRYRERGFNQAAVIAQKLSTRVGVPVDLKILKRVRYTQPQAKMDKAQRAVNVKDAFWVKPSAGFLGSSVLLVDDVFTTGSTLNEAARVLKEAGAGEILTVTLARVELG